MCLFAGASRGRITWRCTWRGTFEAFGGGTGGTEEEDGVEWTTDRRRSQSKTIRRHADPKWLSTNLHHFHDDGFATVHRWHGRYRRYLYVRILCGVPFWKRSSTSANSKPDQLYSQFYQQGAVWRLKISSYKVLKTTVQLRQMGLLVSDLTLAHLRVYFLSSWINGKITSHQLTFFALANWIHLQILLVWLLWSVCLNGALEWISGRLGRRNTRQRLIEVIEGASLLYDHHLSRLINRLRGRLLELVKRKAALKTFFFLTSGILAIMNCQKMNGCTIASFAKVL